ncbi:MAG TPA: enoyl-CoA hydratase/isomerase family protein [Bacilli bacterium]|nr:enoyl-CoA hydratase/isomerase family protein [Bacilli bacterium]
MNDVVRYEKIAEEKVAILRIDRPEASNAINTAVMEGLAAGLAQAREDVDVHVLILTGTGNRVFIAGGDLKEFHAELTSEEIVYEKMSQMRRVLEEIAHFPKPVVAAVNGAARGGGGEVASACHFRIGAETATVGFVQVKLGIAPGWGGGICLQRIVGRQKALSLILSGDVLDAHRAERIGFFDEVVPAESLMAHAKTFAKRLANNSPQAVQSLLAQWREADTLPLKEAMERESRLCAKLWMTPEHDAAVEAFLKRKERKG